MSHCMYRSPLGSLADAGHILESPPRGWVCGCPAGDHELGANCVDSQAKCSIARRYGRTGLPSYSYSKRKHLQEVGA